METKIYLNGIATMHEPDNPVIADEVLLDSGSMEIWYKGEAVGQYVKIDLGAVSFDDGFEPVNIGAVRREQEAIQQATVTLAMLQAPELPDEQAVKVMALYPTWEELLKRGESVPTGERCRWGSVLYKCLQEHVPQADWTPGAAPSLWVEVADPSEEWPLIPNPIPATGPFMKGQKGRVEDGRRFISLIDNNTWQPDEYPAGWKEQK